MRKLTALLLAVFLLVIPNAARADEDRTSGDELIYNGDFSLWTESAELPSGWAFTAYASGANEAEALAFTDEDGNTAVELTNYVSNDARVTQTISVSPDTVYCLSAEVAAENVQNGTGLTLSIDNYSIDETYCYSKNLFGTLDWQQLALCFQTGAEQEKVVVALRLGGYGTIATGTARFRNVSLRACTDVPETVVDLATENGEVSNAGGGTVETETEILQAPTGVLTISLIVSVLCMLAYACIYFWRLRYSGTLLTEQPANRTLAIAVLATAAVVLRVALSLVFYGHMTDINCFMAWGDAMKAGAANFYTSGMFADYPPGYMAVCGALSKLCELLGIGYGTDAMALLFKLPATLADLAGAYLLYRVSKSTGASEGQALTLAGLLLFCPVLAFVSGAWGQIDTVLTLLIAGSFLLLQTNKRILAGAVYGLAILLKPQALMLGPILAVAYIADIFGQDWKKRLVQTVLAVLAALAVLFVLSLPFKGTQNWLWLVEKYADTASSYQYMSIEAFNFASLIGGNWKSIDTLVLGLPYNVWGTIGIGLSVVYAVGLYIAGFRKNRGALYLCAALMTLMIFTFGHYMHERYMLPALLLILFAYAYYKDRRLLLAFGLSGSAALYNVLMAMFIITRQDARGAYYNALTVAGSLLTIAATGYLMVVCFRILVKERVWGDLPLPERDDEAEQPARYEPILPPPTDESLHLTNRDKLAITLVTLVYAVVALTNLGSLKAPQTFWQPKEAGETITVRFDAKRHVGAYSVFGNIDTGGTLMIAADGFETTFEQTYDDMFRWKKVNCDFVSSDVTLTLYAGTLKLNEMAFFDAAGGQIPIVSVAAAGGDALFDEQDTVYETPSYFNGMYFDELYHGRTAYEHLHNLSPYENSHPPLGKLFIMLGVAVFGMTPFGWRVVGALFGVGMLPILYVFGKRMFKNTQYALVCTLLFAFDFMHFTQTRIATIDVYAVFFILLMYYYMYRYITMDFFVDGLRKTLKPLALSGVFFGIGAACKWTCLYAGAGLAVLFFGSLIARYFEYVRARAAGTETPITTPEGAMDTTYVCARTAGMEAEETAVSCYWTNVIYTLLWCCLFFVLVPALIYFGSYTPYYIYEAGQKEAYGLSDMLRTFGRYQEFMYSYHSGLNATHPYQSSWYSWPFTLKPMWYYFNGYLGAARVSTLSASGNPAVWWVSSIGAVVLLVLRLTKRIKPDRALQILCVGVLANYLPWVLVTRCTFIYHFFATVPFILMAAVYALQKLEARWSEAWYVKWFWVGLALLFFVLLYPGLSGLPVSAKWATFIANLPGGKLMYGA